MTVHLFVTAAIGGYRLTGDQRSIPFAICREGIPFLIDISIFSLFTSRSYPENPCARIIRNGIQFSIMRSKLAIAVQAASLCSAGSPATRRPVRRLLLRKPAIAKKRLFKDKAKHSVFAQIYQTIAVMPNAEFSFRRTSAISA
jgi:hypothetical protein